MAPKNTEMNDVKLTMYTKHLSNWNKCQNLQNQAPTKQIFLRDAGSYKYRYQTSTEYKWYRPDSWIMQASLWGKITDTIWPQTIYWKRQKETHHKWKVDVDGDNRKERKGYEGTTKDTFEGHTQDITLKVRIKDGISFNRNDQLLPCDLNELECESTILDPYAYTWNAPENCILSVLKEDHARMWKMINTTTKLDKTIRTPNISSR